MSPPPRCSARRSDRDCRTVVWRRGGTWCHCLLSCSADQAFPLSHSRCGRKSEPRITSLAWYRHATPSDNYFGCANQSLRPMPHHPPRRPKMYARLQPKSFGYRYTSQGALGKSCSEFVVDVVDPKRRRIISTYPIGLPRASPTRSWTPP